MRNEKFKYCEMQQQQEEELTKPDVSINKINQRKEKIRTACTTSSLLLQLWI